MITLVLDPIHQSVVPLRHKAHHFQRKAWEALLLRYIHDCAYEVLYLFFLLTFQSRRFPREQSQKLGPGSHNPQPTENRVDFNRAGASSNFQKPVAVKSEDKCGQSFPAPNTYNLSDVNTGKSHLVTAEAAFKSKTKRDVITSRAARNPAPCQYTIQDQLLHHSASPHKSVFNSKTSRGHIARLTKVIDVLHVEYSDLYPSIRTIL